MLLTHVRAAVAALAAIAIAGVLAVPAQAAVGDIVTVMGTVTDSDGQPLVGVSVYMSSFPAGGFGYATTDSTGAYQIDYTMVADSEMPYLSAGVMNAQCDSLGLLTGAASVTVNCVVAIFEHVTVSGTATTDNGKAPGSDFVNASGPDGTTYGSAFIGADGSYSMDVSFARGATEIYIAAPDGQRVATLTGFADGDVITGVDFTYHPAATWDPFAASIVGKVTDKRGKPVAGAEVGFGMGKEPSATVATGADGTYVLGIETYWNAEVADGTDGFVTINGVLVDFIADIAPDSATTVDYRIGKSPAFEPFAAGLDMRGDGSLLADLWRKVDKNGSAEWAACSDWACTGASFGTKKTALLGVSPIISHSGSTFIVLRDTTGGTASWLRIDPDLGYADQATFGPKKLDGYAYFDFNGDETDDLVAWAGVAGQTTVWTWGANDGGLGVVSTTVDGRFVSAEHLDLDAAGGDDMVVVTRHGNTYTVWS
ncbi:MAG: carboxypeptidase regulatory-like domain-containing protein, partial [Demequinaceae bacterium]|nr:carboxypeptidase regulatory-like domain-containing protein [Demequinaceae bacterium]